MTNFERRSILLGVGASLIAAPAMVKAECLIPAVRSITREELERMNAEFLEWALRVSKELASRI